MKRVVFREFIDMVESSFSHEIADTIIDLSDLASGGAYTSVELTTTAKLFSLSAT